LGAAEMVKSEIYLVYTEKPKRLVCHIHRPTRKGIYYLLRPARRRRGQDEYIKKIALSGFTSLPSGLKRDGTGLPSSGYLLLKSLAEALGTFRLTIDRSEKSALDEKHLVLKHDDLKSLLRRLRTIRSERFAEISGTVQGFLHSTSPTAFEKPKAFDGTYRPNAIADVLKKKEMLDTLSKDDVAAIGEFYPTFIQKYGTAGVGKKRLFALSGSKRATEVVYIKKVVSDFKRRLEAKNLSEQSWQEFLRDYILLFNSNYATVLEKENIGLLGTRFPDFLLIDAYSYLDFYEIKRPTTTLLKKDESHGNYYWSVDLTKAISQVENYIAHADRNSEQLCAEIRRQKQIEARLIKPRGFIIAGSRSQLTDEIMEDNFRLLNNALKNLTIILFDELFNNLQNFLSKLKVNN
jgi:hypothetical protein